MFPFFGSSHKAQKQAQPPFEGLVELDEYLMSLIEFPKDISIQLSKSGSNTIGGPKISLDLGIGINDYVFMSESAKKEARARYGSYNAELRVNALSEIEANILVNYITATGMQTLLSSQRSLRVAYKKAKSDTNALPSAFLLDVRPQPSPGNPQFSVPLFAYEVFFVDQNGERRDMPYEITCRGSFNFREAYDLTSGGLNTSQMSAAREFKEKGVADTPPAQMDAVMGQHAIDFPKTQATGTMKSSSYYHLLYQWGDMLRGSAEISIKVPQTIMGSDWTHERILAYERVLNQNDDVEFAGKIKATAGQVLFTSRYTLDSKNPEVIKIAIPIYVEPLPNHLVMTPNGIKSKWEMTDDVNNLADHQKVELNLRLARPRSNEIWASADFNDDFIISYDEYISPEGVAARRAGRAGASPVPNTQLVFSPEATNSWLSAKKTYVSTSNISGYLNITLPPGRWVVSRVSGDDLAKVPSSYEGAKPFAELSLIEQSKMTEEYGEQAANSSFAPNTIPMAKISVPAAFYWRETDEYDTTPTAIVGAKMIQDMTGATQDVLASFELRDSVPPLLKGKPATTDTIYQKLFSMYPNSEKSGYPNSGGGSTGTSRQVFDTAVMFFKEDSPYDLSSVGLYEQQLESDFDSTVQGYRDLEVPVVNGSVEYNGYVIKRVIIDTSIVTDEESEGHYPTSALTPSWEGFNPFNNIPFRYIPDHYVNAGWQGDYVSQSPGEESIIQLNLPMLAQHRSDGKSFEALVYYKLDDAGAPAKDSNIISLYGVKNSKAYQDRMEGQIEAAIDREGSAPQLLYSAAAGYNELHMRANPSSAILAGQFVLMKAPNHQGWNDVREEVLDKQTESQALLKAIKQVDLQGQPLLPPGETNTEIHNWMGQDPSELGEFRRFGDSFPGALVMFEADILPRQPVFFPVGYVLPPVQQQGQGSPGQKISNEPMAGTYLDNAQANIEFVQEMGTLVAPQPYVDEDDEYNMGFGLL